MECSWLYDGFYIVTLSTFATWFALLMGLLLLPVLIKRRNTLVALHPSFTYFEENRAGELESMVIFSQNDKINR